MTDADNHNGELGRDDLVDDAVFPDTQAIGVLGPWSFRTSPAKGSSASRSMDWMMRGMTCRSMRLSSRSAEGFHLI